jgi:hypothetical protein
MLDDLKLYVCTLTHTFAFCLDIRRQASCPCCGSAEAVTRSWLAIRAVLPDCLRGSELE